MAQLPLRDEDCHYQEWKAALWPKLLDELGINPARFDALLNRVAAERSLALTPHRGEIIEACYHFYMLSLPSEGAEQTRKAIRQVEKLLERDDQLAALQRLRARWTDEAVENAYFAGLWYELECDLERYGIIFIKPLGKFYVSMFRKVPDTRLCIRTACLECTAWWNSRESLRRARPTQEPLRDWIMHLAAFSTPKLFRFPPRGLGGHPLAHEGGTSLEHATEPPSYIVITDDDYTTGVVPPSSGMTAGKSKRKKRARQGRAMFDFLPEERALEEAFAEGDIHDTEDVTEAEIVDTIRKATAGKVGAALLTDDGVFTVRMMMAELCVNLGDGLAGN